jgi:hypothetical protein
MRANSYTSNSQPPFRHIGLAIDSRAEIDAIAARAAADELDVIWQPRDGGPIVGYFCGLRDPDGNIVEFSFGQRLE